MKTILNLVGLLLVPLSALCAAEPTHLRCEYLVNPLGIDAEKPRLSWIIQAGAEKAGSRGQKQTAYQVIVASTPELLAKDESDLWDSGKVTSDATSHIVYSGKLLTSRQQCFWKVKTWLSDGTKSESKPASWEMGLLKTDDWKGQWVEGTGYLERDIPAQEEILTIKSAVYKSSKSEKDVTALLAGRVKNNKLSLRVNDGDFGETPIPGDPKTLTVNYEVDGKPQTKSKKEHESLELPIEIDHDRLRYLRKTLEVDKPFVKARLYVAALGIYHAYINGQRVGDTAWGQEWTDYRKRIRYQEYDVTKMITKGPNVLAGIVGHGWYSGRTGLGKGLYGQTPALLAQLELTYADGTMDQIVSDESWKVYPSPILISDFMLGENYNAQEELKGWNIVGLDESTWNPVKVRKETVRPLESQVMEPVRQVVELKAKTITELKPGTWIYDLGQNMVGYVRLKVTAPAGTKVTLRHAEMLNPDGSMYTTNLRGAPSIENYICKGGGEEIYQPHFTFHGFRYVELTGLTEKPPLDAITGLVLSSDTPKTGEFSCSDPRVNQLYSNIVWGQRGNYLSLPTDCPQRDERMGWLGDAQVFVRTATYNSDIAAFFTKWMVDVADSQQKDGAFPNVAPVMHDNAGTPGWADASVICPWTIYQVYGDTRILEQHYPGMVRWIEFCRTESTELIRDKRRGHDFGDWLSIEANTPKDLIGTAYFAYSTKLVAQVAKVLGKTDDAAKYEQLFEDIKAAFNKKYVAPDGRIHGNTQTCYLMALKFDLLPTEMREKAVQHLLEDIKAKNDHLSTGFIGVSYLLPVLTDAGKTDTAFKLFLQDTFPSWLFSVKHGATTMWERWNGWTPDNGFFNPHMNSFNHYAFGSCGEWMFDTLAGIDTDGPGFKKLIIRPTPGEGITWVKASYDSINGRIVSNWAIDAGKLTMEVTIPINTAATVYVPAKDAASVTESGKQADKANGVKYLRSENGRSIYEVGAGSYQFVSETK